jgi:hypothetical protein
MSALAPTINLQFGKSATSYQHVICRLTQIRLFSQTIPSSRGSHNEISGT